MTRLPLKAACLGLLFGFVLIGCGNQQQDPDVEVECETDEDCPEGEPFCSASSCHPCMKDRHCPGERVCNFLRGPARYECACSVVCMRDAGTDETNDVESDSE